jgi:membrane fusion protein, multidrug efflux system
MNKKQLHKLIAVLLVPGLLSAQDVRLAKVTSGKLERNLQLPGELAPFQRVAIFARVTSFVESVHVDRGSVVRQGDMLASLIAPELDAQVAESEAKAQAVQLQLAEAQAKLVASQTTYEMLKMASATPGAISMNELKLSEQSFEAGRAVVEAVTNTAQAARSAADALKKLQSYLQARAPFDGVITERMAHPGALVGPGTGAASTPLMYIEQNSKLRLVVPVPESQVAGVARGNTVSFAVPAYPGQTFRGTVARVSQTLDTRTRSMAVELDVNNPGGQLSPGMYADVDWPVRMTRNSLLVPASSIVTTTERVFVIRVNNGKAEWVNVTRGTNMNGLVEVFGKLQVGDQVVERASDELREGTTITTAS